MNPKVVNKDKQPIIIKACLSGNKDLVKYLIDAVFTIVHPENNNKDAIDTQLLNDCIEILNVNIQPQQLLESLDKKFQISFQESWLTPMIINAAESGNLSLMKYLLGQEEFNSLIIKSKMIAEEVIFAACLTGNKDLVKYLIEEAKLEYTMLNHLEESILFPACQSGNKDLVKYLIEEVGLDPDKETKHGFTVLFKACDGRGNIDLVKYLIEVVKLDPTLIVKEASKIEVYPTIFIENMNPITTVKGANNIKVSILTLALKGNKTDLIKYLIEEVKLDLKKEGPKEKLLEAVASKGNIETLEYLIENNWKKPLTPEIIDSAEYIKFSLDVQCNAIGVGSSSSELFLYVNDICNCAGVNCWDWVNPN